LTWPFGDCPDPQFCAVLTATFATIKDVICDPASGTCGFLVAAEQSLSSPTSWALCACSQDVVVAEGSGRLRSAHKPAGPGADLVGAAGPTTRTQSPMPTACAAPRVLNLADHNACGGWLDRRNRVASVSAGDDVALAGGARVSVQRER